jgi:hypothetical protein
MVNISELKVGDKIKIPKVTEDKPYIKFEINNKTGKIKLSTSSTWWGGKNSVFISSNGTSGNTCLPKDLKSYLKNFLKKQDKLLQKELKELQKRHTLYRKIYLEIEKYE